MSGDLISRSELLAALQRAELSKEAYSPMGWAMLEMTRSLVKNAPAVEATPIVYGYWEFKSIREIAPNCSRCGGYGDMSYQKCPHCGAIMR